MARKLAGGLLRTVLIGFIILAGLGAGLYFWFLHFRLDKALKAGDWTDGYETTTQLIGRKTARVETAWPLTLRVYVKATNAHNWIPTERFGLVSAALQWVPERNQWVQEQRPAVPLATKLKLEAMLLNPMNGTLIEALGNDDRFVREVAFTELKMRTGKEFGYKIDAAPSDREAAVARWQDWWEKNKIGWTGKKILEKAGRVFE